MVGMRAGTESADPSRTATPSERSRCPPERWKALASGVLLLALVAAAYAPATRNGYIWDDDAYLVENPTLPEPGGLARIWFELGATPQYYPLVHSSFWIEYRLWGLAPTGYHVVNIALHGIAAVLVWRVLLFLTAPGAWAAAAIFALHPVHVESVAWITERKNVLSAVFALGAALAYLRFAAARERPGARNPLVLYGVSLLLFTAALLSKTVTCSLPAALLLILWWKCEPPLGTGRLRVGDVVPLLPFFALGLALAGVTVWMEEHRVGAVGPDWDLSLAERVLIAGRALGFYLGKLVWPHPLSFIYPRWRIDTGSPLQLLAPAAALGLLATLWLARARLGRAPVVAALLFAGTLLPALGFFDIFPMRYSFVADHFQYLASISPIALFCAATARWASRRAAAGPKVAAAALAALLAVLGTLTWSQLPNYRDGETLWRATIETNPDAWIAHYNLGNQRRREGRWAEAIGHYLAALAVKEDLAVAHNNLASALGMTGDLDGAALHYRRAVELDDRYALAHFNLASLLASRAHYAQAIAHFRKALAERPDHAEAHLRLGIALQQDGQREAGLAHLRTAQELQRHARRPPP